MVLATMKNFQQFLWLFWKPISKFFCQFCCTFYWSTLNLSNDFTIDQATINQYQKKVFVLKLIYPHRININTSRSYKPTSNTHIIMTHKHHYKTTNIKVFLRTIIKINKNWNIQTKIFIITIIKNIIVKYNA